MEALLANPLIQSAVVPFVVALVAAIALRPAGRIAAGAGFALAFAVSAWLVMGLQFTPLTSTRKLVLAGAAAVVIGIALDGVVRGRLARAGILLVGVTFALVMVGLQFTPLTITLVLAAAIIAAAVIAAAPSRWARAGVLAAGAAAAALWLAWPRLLRLDGAEMWLMAIPVAAYAAWLVASTEALDERPEAQTTAILSLALGTAVAAVLGASALLGQLAGAVAAATGAYALHFAARGAWRPGAILSVPAVTLAALIGLSAVLFARLPWYTLVPLALIPILARLPLPATRTPLVRLLVAALYTLPAAAATIALTWRETGPPAI